MLTDFYIPKLSNDMNIAVQKNHLRGIILYRSPEPGKNGVILFKINFQFFSNLSRYLKFSENFLERKFYFIFWEHLKSDLFCFVCWNFTISRKKIEDHGNFKMILKTSQKIFFVWKDRNSASKCRYSLSSRGRKTRIRFSFVDRDSNLWTFGLYNDAKSGPLSSHRRALKFNAQRGARLWL